MITSDRRSSSLPYLGEMVLVLPTAQVLKIYRYINTTRMIVDKVNYCFKNVLLFIYSSD